jgi:CheY-like chemotaxis protein
LTNTPDTPRKSVTILSIDDTPLFQQLIKITLEYQNFRVLVAADGVTGLQLARTEVPDLILLDLMMPGMDGVEVCREIMAAPRLKHIPVVLLSSSDDSDDIEACLQMGALGYLLKPFKPAMLVQVVRQHLAASK